MAVKKNEFKMRSLQTKDIFPMSKILKKMNLRSELNSKNEDGTGKEMEQFGMELIVTIVENLHRAQDEVNDLLGNLIGISGEEFNNLEIEDTLRVFAMFKEQKGIANFLKSVGRLT